MTQIKYDEVSGCQGDGEHALHDTDQFETTTIAVADANDLETVESISALNGKRGGVRVWIVTLEGDGKTATVLVDASSGEVLSREVGGGD